MVEVLSVFAVVFVAELGDKTQLVALTSAGRYPVPSVLATLGAAIALLQTLSVTVGSLIGGAVPDRAVAVGAGLVFVGFGWWTWRSATDADPEVGRADGLSGLVGVGAAFFLAELGDKTMLTTAGLAADRGAMAVWVGSFAAMMAATTLAVVGGRGLARWIPTTVLRRAGAIAFFAVGAVTLVGAATT